MKSENLNALRKYKCKRLIMKIKYLTFRVESKMNYWSMCTNFLK